MQELKEQLKLTIEKTLVPFLEKFNFTYYHSMDGYSGDHDLFTFRDEKGWYVAIDYMGFNPHDYPWSMNPMLGKSGYKKTAAQFDAVPLWYWKQKVAPFEKWQREAIKLTFANYPINSVAQIKSSIDQTIFDLDNFCKDFLKREELRFDRIREIRYLEHLVQFRLYSKTHWTGTMKTIISENEEME